MNSLSVCSTWRFCAFAPLCHQVEQGLKATSLLNISAPQSRQKVASCSAWRRQAELFDMFPTPPKPPPNPAMHTQAARPRPRPPPHPGPRPAPDLATRPRARRATPSTGRARRAPGANAPCAGLPPPRATQADPAPQPRVTPRAPAPALGRLPPHTPHLHRRPAPPLPRAPKKHPKSHPGPIITVSDTKKSADHNGRRQTTSARVTPHLLTQTLHPHVAPTPKSHPHQPTKPTPSAHPPQPNRTK